MRSSVLERPSAWYLAPALTFFGLFAVLPMVLVVYLSFTQCNGFGFPAPTGAENWSRLAGDPAGLRHIGDWC
jgi:xylobiose transport system permease protein